MLPRKAKNNTLRGRLIRAGLAAFCALLFAFPAFAVSTPPMVVISASDYSICPTYSGFVYKLVTCIQDVVVWAMMQYIVPFTTYAAGLIGAFITLAAVFLGIMIASGRSQYLARDGFIFIIKASFLSSFAFSFGWVATSLFDTLNWLLNAMAISTFYSSPLCPLTSPNIWIRIDCLLEIIIGGFLPGGSLLFGITGFIVSCLKSGPFGFFLGLMGLGIIGLLMVGVAQCAYTFIMSCISLALMICVMPIFVPMLMLNVTKGYFEKWMRLTLGLLIQPAVLFAYMAMLLLAFDVVMFLSPASIYAALTGAPAVPSSSPPLGSWLASTAYGDIRHGGMVQNVDPSSVFQTNAVGAPMFPSSTDTGGLAAMPKWTGAGIDWSAGNILDQLSVLQPNSFSVYMPLEAVSFRNLATINGMTLFDFEVRLFISFFLAVMVAYILFTMLKHIPYLSSSLAGEFLSGHFVGGLLGQFNPLDKISLDGMKKNINDQNLKALAKKGKESQ